MSMFVAPQATEGGEFTLLEDGCFEAVIVGLRGFTGTKYQSTELEDKMQFVFQVQDDDGALHYLATKPLSNTLSENSNLFKVLNGVTGYGLDKFPIGFQYTQLINSEKPIKCQLTVKTVASKKDPNRQFNEIVSYLKAKKNQKNTFVPDDKAPAWLNQNVKEVFWINGLGFQAPKEAPAKTVIPPAPATQLGDSSVFFGQQGFATHNSEVPIAPFPTAAQVATTPAMQPSPYVPPQAKGQEYVPPAAPAPQAPFGTAPVVDEDEDDSLPFN